MSTDWQTIPETISTNFYISDPNLAQLLRHHLSPEDFARADTLLTKLGAIAAGRMDELAVIAERNGPELVQFDRRGQRVDEVRYHPAYRELEKLAYEDFAIAACTHRTGALSWPEHVPQPVKFAMAYLAMQAEQGVFCPVSMTDALARVLERYASEPLKQRFLPGLTSLTLAKLQQGAMFVTEKQGGSDVGLTATIARRREQAQEQVAAELQPDWELWGEKWFCSNVSADLILTLARPEGALAGTRGLGLYLVPRTLDNGTRNLYRINRLKSKLGTRSMATGEVTLEGALAYQIGEPGRGFGMMAEMINLTRIWAAIGSLAALRRSLHEAILHTRSRIAFGRPLSQQPLMQRQLLELVVATEGAAALAFETAAVLERVDHLGEEDRRLLRILTPLSKYFIPKLSSHLMLEALEIRGGNGYVEDWPNPRMLRDGLVNSIWEGSSNVIALDVLRALEHDGVGTVLCAHLQSRLYRLQQPALNELATQAHALVAQLTARLTGLPELPRPQREWSMRKLCETMAQTTILTLLLVEAENELAAGVPGTKSRKLMVAQLFGEQHGMIEPREEMIREEEIEAVFLAVRAF